MKLAIAALHLMAASALFAQWTVATPESQGMSSKKLDQLRDTLAARKTASFLVIRHDRIVYEWYGPGYDQSRPHGTASLAKSLVGSLSLMAAVADGRLTLDDPVWKYVPQWKDDPRKKTITIRHLATHTSGLEDAEQDGIPHKGLPGWKGEFWRQLDPPRDPFTLARDEARVVFEPGTRPGSGDDSGYSNPGFAMLGYAVASSYRGTPGADVRTLLRDKIMRPIGAGDEEWIVGYKRTFDVDGLPLVANWGGGNYTPRAIARVGRLMLRLGDWDGKRLLPADLVRQATSSGIGWWVRALPKGLPEGSFIGAGAGMEILLVVPSLDVIVVRMGKDLDPDWSKLGTYLTEPLMDAVVKR